MGVISVSRLRHACAVERRAGQLQQGVSGQAVTTATGDQREGAPVQLGQRVAPDQHAVGAHWVIGAASSVMSLERLENLGLAGTVSRPWPILIGGRGGPARAVVSFTGCWGTRGRS